jgi:OOP family OmpA-OmpF porin
MKKLSLIVTIAMLFSSFGGFAQKFLSNTELADKAFDEKNYYTAQEYYQKVFDELENADEVMFPFKYTTPENKNSEFDVYAYAIERMALCYVKYFDYTNAEVWYAKLVSLQEFNDFKDLVSYSKVLVKNAHYEEALVQFNKAKNVFTAVYIRETKTGRSVMDEASKASLRQVDFYIDACNYALKQLSEAPTGEIFKIDTFKVNTPDASNYAASMMDDEKFVFTTSRLKNKNKSSKSYGAFVNSLMTYNNYDSALIKLDFGFGLDRHVASPSVSRDGQRLYVTIWSDEDGTPFHKIFMSRPLNDSLWTTPVELNDIVNVRDSRTKNAHVTHDGSGLYFASDRNGGFGKMDIYYCRLDNNGMPVGRAVNLGPNVNTPEDEVTPFFDAAVQGLYFSSEGHIGMGGFDVMLALRDGNAWKLPVNIGYPINSNSDDAYFVVSDKSPNMGYFSSDRDLGCCYELFGFELSNSFVAGVVLDAVDNNVLENVKVTLLDSTGTDELLVTYTDFNGNYVLPITGKIPYKITYTKENFLDDEAPLAKGSIAPSDTLYLPNVKLITIEVNRAVKLENILYDYGKASLRPESKVVLDKLASQLIRYPYLVVEIGSHTDSKGSLNYNQKLSRERSQSVVDYMITKGIQKDMIVAKGYGEIQPLVSNTNDDGSDNPENRQLNRRTEFKILENRLLSGKAKK